MKKTLKSTMALVGATALTLGATVAHADDNVETTPVAPETVESAETVETTEVAPVTAEQVEQAKTELDNTNQEVAQAQAETDKAQSEFNQAENEVAQAQADVNNAQAIADQATPETIADQEQAVAQAETNVTDTQNAVTTAQDNLDSAKSSVSDQETTVATEQAEVNQAQADVNTAQNAVDNAQAILDGTGQAEVIAEKESADKALDQAKTDVASKEQALDQAKQADQERETAIKNAEKEVSTTANALEQSNTNLEKAQNTAQETAKNEAEKRADVTKATEKVNDISDEIANHNTITVPTGYAEALKEYAKSGTSANSDKVSEVAKSGNTSNAYKGNEADKKVIIPDVNNLTQAQREELTLFTVDLMNQVREQMGTQKVVSNKSAIEFADKVSDKSDPSRRSHDVPAIVNSAKEMGLLAQRQVNEYEDLGFALHNANDTLTLNDLKKDIYKTVVAMMFDDSHENWGHAVSLGGAYANTQLNSKYVGVDFSNEKDSTYFTYPKIHILSVANFQVQDTTKFNTTDNLTQRDLQKELATANQALTQAKSALTVAENNNKTAQDNLANAKNANTQAKTANAKANQNLANAKAVPVKTPTAQANLTKAQSTLASAQDRANKAQQALDTLNADVKTKQQNLANAKADLLAKQAVLVTKQDDLTSAQTELARRKALVTNAENELTKAKANATKAEQALKQAQSDLDTLLNADDNLANAKAVLANKETTLASKQETLDSAKSKLDELLAQQAIDQATYDELLARYNAQEEAKRLAELEAKKQEIAKAGQTPVAIVDETGKVVDYVAKAEPSNVVNRDTLSTTKIAVSYQPTAYGVSSAGAKELPTTGDNTAKGGLLIGLTTLLGAFGLAGRKRKFNK